MKPFNGQQAVEKVMQRDYDLVLMDLHMPICSGFEATERLRQQGITLPIVALTADVLQTTQERCRQSGFSGFASKPIDYDKLVEELKSHLEVDNTSSHQDDSAYSSPSPFTEDSSDTQVEQSDVEVLNPQAAIAQMHVDMDDLSGGFRTDLTLVGRSA